MTDAKSYVEIAYSSIGCFADDGTLDIGELNFLLGIALRDGYVDEDEKRVLRGIFCRVSEAEVSPQVWDRIQTVKRLHGIDWKTSVSVLPS